MYVTILRSKIHRATLTETKLHYAGSVTLDRDLIDAAGLLPFESVHVFNINTGDRLQTYVIEGEQASGAVCLNGAAARLGQPGDLIIIVAYAQIEKEEAASFAPTVVHVDGQNRIVRVDNDPASP